MEKKRKFLEPQIIVASHNQGKVREISDLLKPYGIEAISAAELGLNEPEETGKTFVANAELKALKASKTTNKPSLSDDSGLVIPALNGEPGIYSARWAGKEKDFNLAMNMVEERLGAGANRSAYFIAALALCWPDGHCETFEGRVEGNLIWPPRGELGFGYDPMFVPSGGKNTFGEMEPAAKHAISHRAKAFAKLEKACFDN